MNEASSQEQITLTRRLRYRAVADEGVLVNLDSGRAIVVNEVGLHIIQQLASPKTREVLAASISSHFDIDIQQATVDLDIYLAELHKEQVLESN